MHDSPHPSISFFNKCKIVTSLTWSGVEDRSVVQDLPALIGVGVEPGVGVGVGVWGWG